MGIIRILYKEPDKPWMEAEVENSLEAMQTTVGGYIEAVTLSKNMVLICNEEGHIKGLPYNTRVMGVELVGNIFVCGVKGDEFTDVPVSLADWQRYWIGGRHG